MKKIVLALSFLLIAGISYAFADEKKISPVVLESFENEFSAAQEVSWQEGTGYYRAAFLFNGQNLAAYFSMEGELLSLERKISVLQLPLSLFIDLKNNHSESWITDLTEVKNNGGTQYYITLENANKVLRLSSTNGSDWKKLSIKRKL